MKKILHIVHYLLVLFVIILFSRDISIIRFIYYLICSIYDCMVSESYNIKYRRLILIIFNLYSRSMYS